MHMRAIAGLAMVGAALAVQGCSGHGSSPGIVTPVGGAATSTTTPLQTFQALQASGQIPVLDLTTSLTGTDADGNGVRDDLDKYIAGLPDTAAQKKALTQLAQALQTTLTVDTTNSSALAAVSASLFRGDTCVWQQYSSGQQHAKAMAYDNYNAARNGAVVTPPTGTVCN